MISYRKLRCHCEFKLTNQANPSVKNSICDLSRHRWITTHQGAHHIGDFHFRQPAVPGVQHGGEEVEELDTAQHIHDTRIPGRQFNTFWFAFDLGGSILVLHFDSQNIRMKRIDKRWITQYIYLKWFWSTWVTNVLLNWVPEDKEEGQVEPVGDPGRGARHGRGGMGRRQGGHDEGERGADSQWKIYFICWDGIGT